MALRQAIPVLSAFVMLGGISAQADEPIKANKVLQTSTSWMGQNFEYPKTDKPIISSSVVEFAPGAKGDWHYHPVPEYVYVLEGTITIEDENGQKKDFHAGEAFIEVTNNHYGRNDGNTPAKILAVLVGAEGLPNSVDRATQ